MPSSPLRPPPRSRLFSESDSALRRRPLLSNLALDYQRARRAFPAPLEVTRAKRHLAKQSLTRRRILRGPNHDDDRPFSLPASFAEGGHPNVADPPLSVRSQLEACP